MKVSRVALSALYTERRGRSKTKTGGGRPGAPYGQPTMPPDPSYTACQITLCRALDHPHAAGRRLYHDVLPQAELDGWQVTRMETLRAGDKVACAAASCREAAEVVGEVLGRARGRGILDGYEQRSVDQAAQTMQEIAAALEAAAGHEPYTHCQVTLQRDLAHPNAASRELYHDVRPAAEQQGWQAVHMEMLKTLGPMASDHRDFDRALGDLYFAAEDHDDLLGDVDDVRQALETLMGVAEGLESAADAEVAPNPGQLALAL